MGYYLETPDNFGKAETLVKMYGGAIVDESAAAFWLTQGDEKAVICVVRNPEFEAAAFCHNVKEFNRFTRPEDPRAKTWVVLDDRAMVERLTGYAQDMATIGEE